MAFFEIHQDVDIAFRGIFPCGKGTEQADFYHLKFGFYKFQILAQPILNLSFGYLFHTKNIHNIPINVKQQS